MDRKRVRGTVINVHAMGATVRLEDGRLMAVPIGDVNANRASYTRALDGKTATIPFDLVGKTLILAKTRVDEAFEGTDQAPVEPVAPIVLNDPAFEAQIAGYLKETEAWAPADRPEPFERHLFRKKQRAKQFRGENSESGESLA
ncbi:MAG: hypothetical protein NVSMB64_05880 [Candidatus Velthaea sp.]